MKKEELLAHYPKACRAIAWVEIFIVNKPDDEVTSAWDDLVASGMTPVELRDAIKDISQDEPIAQRMKALPEMDHPDFLTYLKGKIGCV